MRITELIEELQDKLQELGDVEVMSSSNYGDYCKTEQLDEIMSVEPCKPVESAYSHTGFAFPATDDPMDDEDTEIPNRRRPYREAVLVLRYTY